VHEAHAFRSQSVHVRRLDRPASLHPQIAVAQIVRQDHDQVGAKRLGAGCGPHQVLYRLYGLLGMAERAPVDVVVDRCKRGVT
jgi:hypothetical protein